MLWCLIFKTVGIRLAVCINFIGYLMQILFDILFVFKINKSVHSIVPNLCR